jgi:hypothetical protein
MKRSIATLSITFSILGYNCETLSSSDTYELEHFAYGAAWVLPLTSYRIENDQTEYIVLGKEAYGPDKGTYDAFGGKKDHSDNKKSLITAAREFVEEAITQLTLDMSIDRAKNHIDLRSQNTTAILAINDIKYKARTVTYLSRFSYSAIEKLVTNFPQARAKVHHHAQREKNGIAIVTRSDFEAAVKGSLKNSHITVSAKVWDDKGNVADETITLRPIFVRLMRSYVENKPYEQGKDPRIRFYTIS